MNRWLIGLWALMGLAAGAASFDPSDESLNELKKLPQFARYFQRLKKPPPAAPLLLVRAPPPLLLESPLIEGSGASYSDVSSTALPTTWDIVRDAKRDDTQSPVLPSQQVDNQPEPKKKRSNNRTTTTKKKEARLARVAPSASWC